MSQSRIAPSVRNPRAAVLSYFTALQALPEAEIDALRLMISRLTAFKQGSEIAAAGELLQNPMVLASGWVCRAAALPDGRRQILDFYLPGELVAYSSRRHAAAVAPYVCLTRVECAPADQLLANALRANPRYPVLASICRSIEQQAERQVLSQIVRNGRQTAFERVAHLLTELFMRLQRSGLTDEGGFVLPLTQEVMAEAVGLSTVHMNRTMQQLRGEGLVASNEGRLMILDPGRLRAAAGLKDMNSGDGSGLKALPGNAHWLP